MTRSGQLRWASRLAAAVALVGVAAGLGGVVLTVILHTLEHIAFGASGNAMLAAVSPAPPWQRVAVLTAAGLLAGIGWWALRRWGRPVVSVPDAVAGTHMPAGATSANVLLQIGIVGLGGSIGREAAPRELAAMMGDHVAQWFRLTPRERRILVASAAGAGLAAVYNVPLGGALFAVEILLAELSFAAALPAFVCAALAALVGRLVIPADALYTLPTITLDSRLVMWAVPVGLVCGVGAGLFMRVVNWLTVHRPRGAHLIWVMPAVFAGVGLISVWHPDVLGNGIFTAQAAFAGTASAGVLFALLATKTVATAGTIGAGAVGGTLTPSVALGASLGALVGVGAGLITPGTSVAGYALLGAAAFLACTMRAPFTATVLVLEFTGQGPGVLVPVMLAVAAALSVGYLVERRRAAGVGE